MLQQMTKAMTKGKFRGLGGMMGGGMPNMSRMHGFGRKKRLKQKCVSAEAFNK